MIKETKRGIFILVEIVSFIVFFLLCLGIFYLIGNRNIDENENNVQEESKIKSANLKYIINNSLDMNVDISLEKEESEELYDLIKSLEFGQNETKCLINPVYYLEYDENELYLDMSCGSAIYNGKEYSVTNGKEEVSKFLENIMNTMNNVYLFSFDQRSQKAQLIEIDDEGKNEIRSIWTNHNKETMTMNLAVMLQYYLYIDGDVVGINEIDDYVSYNTDSFAGHIMQLNQDMQTVLEKYIVNSDCCSCCPNLQPGEYCIDLCCPCN